MANHKSAIKRIRSDYSKNQRNKYLHKTVRNLIKKLKEIEIEPKVLHETDEERIEEYTLPVEFFDELTKDERDSLYCWLNKDTIAQA